MLCYKAHSFDPGTLPGTQGCAVLFRGLKLSWFAVPDSLLCLCAWVPAVTGTTEEVKQQPTRFSYVEEHETPFLALWPHRYDYLWAKHPDPGQKPQWQTEGRHPLADRLITQGSYLYGVRFGAKTSYAMLDIDSTSAYHPSRDPLAIPRLTGALEEKLHLTAWVTVQSSWSGGLHLYFPFEEPLKTFDVATAVTGVLEQAGFKIAGGLLEVFPNQKPFSSDGSLSLYQGHRLPLQNGSYLLNEEGEAIYSSQDTFLTRWRWAVAKNALDETILARTLKTLRKPYRISQKAAKFLNDLNAEIEQGWTGSGQTNRLLGRIAMRAYVFGQTLLGLAQPLTGKDLIETIIDTAKSLPGFHNLCGHQDDLADRAKAWARSVESSHYYPYGSGKKPDAVTEEEREASWNQRQQEAARERIRAGVAQLLNSNSWPAQTTSRFKALTGEGISGATLYMHKDLWHPNHVRPHEEEATAPDRQKTGIGGNFQRQGEEFQKFPPTPTSLLGGDGCNTSDGNTSSPTNIKEQTQQAVIAAREHLKQRQYAYQQQRSLTQQLQYRQRMMNYLNSGDPILQQEAQSWLQKEGYG